MAATVFLVSLTGVLLFSTYTSNNAAASSVNLQMAQYATRVLMERTSAGPLNVGTNMAATPVTLPSGHVINAEIQVAAVTGGQRVTVILTRTGSQVRYVQSALAITPAP